MRLVKVGLWGYKRFREQQEMDVDGPLIAIVGPNEAGKTSLLRALYSHLNEPGESMSEGELTRNATPQEAEIWARYALEDADREALGTQGIGEAADVRHLVVYKYSDGSFWHTLEPRVQRDLEPRRRALKSVERVLGSRWLRENDDESGSLSATLVQAQRVLASSDDTLDDSLELLRECLQAIAPLSLPTRLARCGEHLEQVLEYEIKPHPNDLAVEILEARRPKFRFFSEDVRRLRSSYRLDEGTNQALHNFLSLAGTSWHEISTAHPDEGRLRAIEEKAEGRLAEAFASWRQAELNIRLRISNQTVFVLVGMEKAHDYVGVEDRSDGLRQFIALRAYVRTQEDAAPPILLIDEAETHLHYDAQADLVQILAEQDDAAKVVYTTHSAGCLPTDLGTGVRMVLPRREERNGELHMTDDSEIVNWFWLAPTGGTGFSPLLLGMGASTFAFASTRKAVLAEGAADAILLPSLFREVCDIDQLDFQVAPGLAHVTKELAREVDLVAARVAYLVDADKGGRDRRKQLRRAGVPASRIFSLSENATTLTLEDLIQKDVYRAAVNRLLQDWHGVEIPASAIPSTGRHEAVERWCARRSGNIAAPSKRAIAQAIVEQRHQKKLVAGNRRQGLRALHARIERLLSEPTHRVRHQRGVTVR